MTDRPQVLVTDFAWPNLDIERVLLDEEGADLVVAGAGDSGSLRDLAAGVSAIMTCWAPVPAEVLDAAPGCVVVARYGVGLDNIDIQRATELGILVTNVPDYCIDEVAEHTLALMLACVRRVAVFDRQTRAGRWDNKAAGPVHRLRGQTLGLVGYGRIARAVAVRARAFGMTIATYDPMADPAAEPRPDHAYGSLNDLLSAADVVSVHIPLGPKTRGLIGSAELAVMKPTAFLLNTARGGLVDLEALQRAFQDGQIRGAAVDVLPAEPPPAHVVQDRAEDFIVTPHAAFYSEESVADLQYRTAAIVAACLRGQLPPDIANPTVLESPQLRLARR